jgi:hypothetical protein
MVQVVCKKKTLSPQKAAGDTLQPLRAQTVDYAS